MEVAPTESYGVSCVAIANELWMYLPTGQALSRTERAFKYIVRGAQDGWRSSRTWKIHWAAAMAFSRCPQRYDLRVRQQTFISGRFIYIVKTPYLVRSMG